MLVTVQAPSVVGPTNAFGEVYAVVGDGEGGLNATGLSDRGTVNIEGGRGGLGVTNTEGRRADFNPERIQIDDDSTLTPGATPAADIGAVLADVTGVVSYSFGNYEVLATGRSRSPSATPLAPETSALAAGPGQLLVASYNVLNLDPKVEDVALVADQDPAEVDDDVGDGRFAAVAEHIAGNLNAPDIVALQEVQDNDGAESHATSPPPTSRSRPWSTRSWPRAGPSTRSSTTRSSATAPAAGSPAATSAPPSSTTRSGSSWWRVRCARSPTRPSRSRRRRRSATTSSG